MDTENIRIREKIKETLATEGAKIIAQKLRTVARETLRAEMKADPFTNPGDIVKARQLRYVLRTLIPNIIEGYVNHEPDAPDKKTVPNETFTIMQWFRKGQ